MFLPLAKGRLNFTDSSVEALGGPLVCNEPRRGDVEYGLHFYSQHYFCIITPAFSACRKIQCKYCRIWGGGKS